MSKNKNNKNNGNTKKVSTKPVKVQKNINRNGKNSMRFNKTDKK